MIKSFRKIIKTKICSSCVNLEHGTLFSCSIFVMNVGKIKIQFQNTKILKCDTVLM